MAASTPQTRETVWLKASYMELNLTSGHLLQLLTCERPYVWVSRGSFPNRSFPSYWEPKNSRTSIMHKRMPNYGLSAFIFLSTVPMYATQIAASLPTPALATASFSLSSRVIGSEAAAASSSLPCTTTAFSVSTGTCSFTAIQVGMTARPVKQSVLKPRKRRRQEKTYLARWCSQPTAPSHPSSPACSSHS